MSWGVKSRRKPFCQTTTGYSFYFPDELRLTMKQQSPSSSIRCVYPSYLSDATSWCRCEYNDPWFRNPLPRKIELGNVIGPSLGKFIQCFLDFQILQLNQEVELSSPKPKENIAFRPHTSAILMHCIQRVLQASENNLKSGATLPIVSLDLPQRLLFRWGQTTYWSWNNWDDDRVVGSDSLTVLVRGYRRQTEYMSHQRFRPQLGFIISSMRRLTCVGRMLLDLWSPGIPMSQVQRLQ
jgi:hypothetical protein